jgi:hypothetical protein
LRERAGAGVLIPPSGYDEDDAPIYSEVAIERAVTYACLLDEIGHESAVIALWGNEVGPGVPRATILTALTAAQEAQLKRVETVREWLDPQAVKHQRLRRERQLTACRVRSVLSVATRRSSYGTGKERL